MHSWRAERAGKAEKAEQARLHLHPWGVSCLREPDGKATYSRGYDLLWKGILEDLFEDFLTFFFPRAAGEFDLHRGVEYLDKELPQLFPPQDGEFAPRYVDKLVKVFTRENPGGWVLLHCEVQGYPQREFSERMFRYYCRIRDKYHRPLTALAILTDGDKGFRPDQFRQTFLGSQLLYRFNTCKLLELDEKALLDNPNPFAMVLLTARAVLKGQKRSLQGKELYRAKLELAHRVLRMPIPEEKQRILMNFLRYYLRLQDPALEAAFEQTIYKITGGTIVMGIEELLLTQARQEGKVEGEREGEARGKKEGEARMKERELFFVQALLRETAFDNEKIASLAGVTEAFVEKVRAGSGA